MPGQPLIHKCLLEIRRKPAAKSYRRDTRGGCRARCCRREAKDAARWPIRVGPPSPSVPTRFGLVPMEVGASPLGSLRQDSEGSQACIRYNEISHTAVEAQRFQAFRLSNIVFLCTRTSRADGGQVPRHHSGGPANLPDLQSDWRGRAAGRVGPVWILLTRWCDRKEIPALSRGHLRDRKAPLDADLLTADPMHAGRRTVVPGERIRNTAGAPLAVSVTRANLRFRGVARVCAQRTRHRPRSRRRHD